MVPRDLIQKGDIVVNGNPPHFSEGEVVLLPSLDPYPFAEWRIGVLWLREPRWQGPLPLRQIIEVRRGQAIVWREQPQLL